VTLSTDVDDMSPEYLDPLRVALMNSGAIDVQIWSTLMKKGRPGFRIEVICSPGTAEDVTEALFLHSTTLGLRRTVHDRITLRRSDLQVSAGNGQEVAVKVVHTAAGIRAKAEFDDVKRVAEQTGRPAFEIAREIEAAARSMVLTSVQDTSRSS
jgi:uncharacterized protein (DUF111 family)